MQEHLHGPAISACVQAKPLDKVISNGNDDTR